MTVQPLLQSRNAEIAGNLTENDLRNFANSFITPDIIKAAKIRRVTDLEGAEIIAKQSKAGISYSGLIFPYFLPTDYKSVRQYRLRRDNPDLEQKTDGTIKEKAKYLSASGTKNMFYFPPSVSPQWLSDISLPIIITEGEKKTLALYRLAKEKLPDDEKWRFLPIGLGGVWNFRGTVSKAITENGERQDVKGIIPDFQFIDWKNRTVYILFDANVTTNENVKFARNSLSKTLKEHGAKVVLIDLPQENNVNGVDDLLGLWERTHGTDAAITKGLKLLEDVQTEQLPPCKLGLTFGELQSLALPKREEIIKGLAKCENGLLNAVTNVGKTTLIRNLALSLITGRNFPPLSVSNRKMRVAIIDSEDTLIFLRSDINKMIADFSDVEKNEVEENLFLICDVSIADDEELRINKDEHFKLIVSAISEFQADIVFVDTISRSFVIHNENDNSEVKERVMKPLKRFAKITNSAVLASHHIGKAKLEEGQSKEGSHRGRGASAFGDQSRVIFNLEKDSNEDVILSCPKLKGEKFQDTMLKLNKENRWFTKQAEIKIQTNYEIVIERLEKNENYKRSEIDEIFAGEITRSTLTRVLKNAVEKGDLTQNQKGFYTLNAQMLPPYSNEHLSIGCKSNQDKNLQDTKNNDRNGGEHNFEVKEIETDIEYF